MSEPAYYIDRLSASNLQHLYKLHFAVYGKPAPARLFDKKYDTAFTGVSNIGYIAFNNEGIAIGYYGVIPCFLSYEGKRVVSAQSADTMTHPVYRFKGLFVELATLTYALCRQQGIHLVIGFPNQNSYHGAVNRLGWKMTDTMDCFTLPVSALPVEKMAVKLRASRIHSWFIGKIMRKLEWKRDGIGNMMVEEEGFAGIYRDEDYMQYKTYNDNHVIRIGESLVWLRVKNGLIIGDMRLATGSFSFVIDQLKKLAAKLGCTRLQFHCSPGTRLHALFSERFAITPSFPVLFQDLDSGLQLEKFKFSFADIDIF